MTGVALVGMVEGLEKLVVGLVAAVSISGGALARFSVCHGHPCIDFDASFDTFRS